MAQRFRLRSFLRAHRWVVFASAAVLVLSTARSSAQSTISCFPTCDGTDGRFLALSGTDHRTFAGDIIVLGLGAQPSARDIEIGIFDGETGNMWDIGSAALEYTLWADPYGNGEAATLLRTWGSQSMVDNGWWTFRMDNVETARASNGNFVYMLRVRMLDTTLVSTSSFKVRTSGTITVKSHQALSIYAPLTRAADAYVIYPNYPDLSTTTYDGTWRLFIDAPTPSSNMTIWDGDMDRGSFDGSVMDGDDPDTRNDIRPSWATPATAFEGVATTAWPIRDPNRPGSTIRMSGDPADNNQNTLYRRTDPITYELRAPDGSVFRNDDPSGNLEWEQFRLDVAPFNRAEMDYHVDSVALGIYEVRVAGMDMGNVNAWRFFNTAVGMPGVSNVEVVGVDPGGAPVPPLRAVEFVDGSATGVVFYDADSDEQQAGGEPGIPSVGVTLTAFDNTGAPRRTFSTITDANGRYRFDKLGSGRYAVSVSAATLESDVVPTADADGISTANQAEFSISIGAADRQLPFGYRRTDPPGTRTRGYWVNHPENWPLAFISLGYVPYTKDQAIAILQRATSGDKTYSMAAQLIATKLNLAWGNQSSCISDDVAAADEWLYTYPIGTKKCNWRTGEPIHNALDAYNNGLLCAPHVD